MTISNPSQAIILYRPTLEAIAMRLLRSKADAEDVVQETFIKWLNAEHEKIKNTKAYLIRAVTNNCINHLQALKRKKEQYLDSFHWADLVEKFKDSDISTEVETQLGKAFHLIQHKLEPLERAVYVLKEAFDFDYKSLQVLLDKKQEHCRQLFCRARKKIEQERAKLNIVIDEKTALFKTFVQSCEVGEPDHIVEALKNEVTDASLKKN